MLKLKYPYNQCADQYAGLCECVCLETNFPETEIFPHSFDGNEADLLVCIFKPC